MPLENPSDIFSASLSTTLCRSSNLGRLSRHSTYKIYPVCKLNELVADVREDAHPLREFRYLVDADQRLWFAREGGPNGIIPEHYKMTGEPSSTAKCLAAGNITFSDDYKFIVSVNHKSGDFRPQFDSIKWVLAILVASEPCLGELSIELAPKLLVAKLTSSGGEDNVYHLEKEALTGWVRAIFDVRSLSKQPADVRNVSYGFEPPASAGRLQVRKLFLFSVPLVKEDADDVALDEFEDFVPPEIKRPCFYTKSVAGSQATVSLDVSSDEKKTEALGGSLAFLTKRR